jgi:hypothetical protein
MAHVDLISQASGEIIATVVLMDQDKIECRGKSAHQLEEIFKQGIVGKNQEDLFPKDGIRFLEALKSWFATHADKYGLRATPVLND